MTPGSARWRSIDRKLPLLMTVLVLGTVVGVSYTAYARVERILLASAAARLQSASTSVALLLSQSAAQDKQRLMRIAADPALGAFLASRRDTTTARRALARGFPAPVVQSRVELRDASGAIVLDATQGSPPRGSGWIERMIASGKLAPTAPQVGPFSLEHDSIYGESVGAIGAAVPAPAGDAATAAATTAGGSGLRSRPRGYISEVSYLSASGVQVIRDLIGVHAGLLLGSPREGVWTDLERRAAPPPPGMTAGRAFQFDAPPWGAGVGAAVAITGTPWVLWVELPRETVLAPMHQLLIEMAVVAALFTIAGVAGGWLLSRGITKPLVALAQAAERIAADELSAGARATGPAIPEHALRSEHDEVSRLSDAFRRMADRVRESRDALERQVTEARALAGQLDAANEDLRAAVATAGEARDAAQAADRAKSDFLAVISHELRTPLNAIIGYADLLQGGVFGSVTGDQQETLRRMRRSADHLLRLINQVLDIERSNAGGELVLFEPTSLADLVRGAVAEIEVQASERGLTLVVEQGVPSRAVVADAGKLRQILLNLLSNAVKYTERGEVRVGARWQDGSLELVVRDTGIGIRPEHRALIFEPFWQADQRLTRKVGGTGLGLTIVHRLTRLLGGEIVVESVPGAGTTFTVRVPVTPQRDAAA